VTSALERPRLGPYTRLVAQVLKRVRETEREIRVTGRWGLASIATFALAGVGLAAGCTIESSVWRWLLLGGSGLAFAIGVMAIRWRDDLTLDLASRTYRWRRGYLPRLTTRTGSFEDLDAVVLAIDLLPGDGQRQPIPNWVVSLTFKGAAERVELTRFQREAPAYARARELARKLGLPLTDETSGRAVTTATGALDRPLAAAPQAKEDARIAPPPVASRITISGDAPARRIVLPPIGPNVGLLVIAPFPAILMAMAVAGVRHDVTRMHAVQPATVALAAICIAVAVLGSMARERVVEGPTAITFDRQAAGLTYGVVAFRKAEIEEVDVRPVPRGAGAVQVGTSRIRPTATAREELFVRAGARVLRRGGALSRADLDWLRAAVVSMIRS
jgi:hypothetical protein